MPLIYFQRCVLGLVFFFSSMAPAISQEHDQLSYEQLEGKADSLWYSKSFIGLLPVLESLYQRSKSQKNHRRSIASLIQLHEYMAYCERDNEKAIEYLVNAMDLADQHSLDTLRLRTRSQQLYFHQTTTRDMEILMKVQGEMEAINKTLGSEFYNYVNRQWRAQIIGTQRFMGADPSLADIKTSVSVLRETVNYFKSDDEEHKFYYQQVRRSILGFYGDYFGYERCVKYMEEIQELAPRMKDPITEMANLILEGAFLLDFEKYSEVVDRFSEEAYLLESANQGMSKFYFEMLSKAYKGTNEYKKALDAAEKRYFYDKEVNDIAFANKVDAVRLNNESIIVQKENAILSTRNKSFLIIGGLMLTSLIGVWYSLLKIKSQSKIIENQRNDLEEANRAKIKLFGILSHDLQTPISSFSNLSMKIDYLVEQKDWTRLNAMTGQIENSVSNLDSILKNLLPWMSSQIKNTNLAKEKINLNDAVMECAGEFSSPIRDKNIELSINMDYEMYANIQPGVIRITLRNLLSNAIKFSDKGGEIKVNGTTLGNEALVVIEDNGVGMNQEGLKTIFSEYKSTEGTAGERGHGLGLKLSKDIVIANGGRIEITSEEGKGTKVQLVLPKW